MLQQESLVHIYLFFHPWKFTFTKPTPNFRAHSTPYCESHIGNRTGGTNSFMSAWQASCSQNHCHKFKVNNIITIHKFPLLPGLKDTNTGVMSYIWFRFLELQQVSANFKFKPTQILCGKRGKGNDLFYVSYLKCLNMCRVVSGYKVEANQL